ncbi:hypothetical protein EV122DRAFT_280306 [Schizophyllum commune]
MTVDSSPQKIEIAIIGGGIGGLAFVLAMQRFCDMSKLNINVYEAATKISQIGAGITVWPRTIEMLADLGMGEDFEAFCIDNEQLRSFVCRKSDQPEGHTFREIFLEDGNMLMVHRAEVQEIFLKYISKDIHFHLSHRLESYTYADANNPHRIYLKFRNGQAAHCDLLIGADGVNSVVRRAFLPRLAEKYDRPEYKESIEPLFSGSSVYRGLIPREKLAKRWPGHPALDRPYQYCGKNMHIVVFPVQKGRFINVVPFYFDRSREDTTWEGPALRDATREEILKMYEGWEPEVQALLECMENPTHWAILTVKPVDIYADDGVILLGDAVHALTPHLGAGAGQAIEDAYVLGRILGHVSGTAKNGLTTSSLHGVILPSKSISIAVNGTSPSNCISPALISSLSEKTIALYNRLRPPIANFVQARARLQTRFYNFNEVGEDLSLIEAGSPVLAEVKEGAGVMDEGRLAKLGHGICDGYHWRKHSIVRETDEEMKRLLGDAV